MSTLNGVTPEAPAVIRLSALGCVTAALFFTASLTPSLMPRDAVMQGVLGGAVAILGHELTFLVLRLWRFLELPAPRGGAAPRVRAALLVLAVAIVVVGLWAAPGWQDEMRRVVGLPPVEGGHRLTIAGVAGGTFLALWLLSRLLGTLARRIAGWAGRVLPPKIAGFLGLLAALWLVWGVVDGTLVRSLLNAADASFEAADAFIDPEQPPPSDPMKTGSAESLLRWDELGRWGRDYVARAPTADEIAAFAGSGALDPIRVYVGRRSASDPRARAELALAELIRQGAFEREALVAMTPVGTGWMDPGAHDTLDFIMGGDVATVSVQYSYLTSVLSLLVHPEYGIEQGRVLFEVIYDHWTGLPPDARPRLYLHGLSQGALNSQLSVNILDLLADPIDGALWAGSPFMSPYWAQVRDHAAPDSPPWRPRYGNGSLIRVMDQRGGLEGPFSDWGPIRLVLLQYPSDAIVHFGFDTAFRRPDWLRGERPPDISPELRWVPVVTMFQLAMDMALSLQVPRYGHFYAYPDYIDAWAGLVDPPGWTPERAAALRAVMAGRGPAW